MRNIEKAIFSNMCMVADADGNVLVENRACQIWPGIAFPGGHVEDGESFTDAVIREVWEETGLTISHPKLCGIKDWVREDGVRYVVFLYKTTEYTGQLTSSQEGDVWWEPLENLSSLNLASGMDTMLRVLVEEELSEEFFWLESGAWKEVLK